jgi:uncharacterized protein
MSGLPAIFRHVLNAPAASLLGLIRIYQRTLSPILPVITLGACSCRFSPSCSHYAADAIRTHGVFTGLRLAIVRLLKCTPLHPGGNDPVPSRRSSPRCAAVPRNANASLFSLR